MAEFIPTYVEPEEHEVVLATTHRTKPAYPTDGPADQPGVTWNQHFRVLRKDAPVEVDSDEDAEPPVTLATIVLEAAADVDPVTAPGNAGAVSRRLLAREWTVRVRRSVVQVPEVLYKSDSAEDAKDQHSVGDVRYPAYRLETLALLGVIRAPDGTVGVALDATWEKREDKSLSFQGARSFDVILGHEIRRGYLKSRAANETELADGISPPLGLKDWLNIVAPEAPKKTTTKRKETAE